MEETPVELCSVSLYLGKTVVCSRSLLSFTSFPPWFGPYVPPGRSKLGDMIEEFRFLEELREVHDQELRGVADESFHVV